jgi:sugar phosphate isomerase/epimerase
VPPARSFGVSTHLFHGQRLGRDQLREIGAHGFDHVELFATRTHFDYHNPSVVAELPGWLADARVTLQAVHAPVGERFVAGQWEDPLSLAHPDAHLRQKALGEAERALYIARRIPYSVLVVHLGLPKHPHSVAGENSRDAARRSVETLHRQAEPLGVQIAAEVIVNELSRPATLVHFVEKMADAGRVGICLDFGHAHLGGDVVEAIEAVSEHLVALHVHDNRGRADEHLLPFEGTIDWPGALTAVQKVGYDGPVTFEVPAQGRTNVTLEKLREIRKRMEPLLAP